MNSSTSGKNSTLLGKVLGIESDSRGSRVAASYYDYESETSWSFRGDSWFHAASTMKVAVLLGLFSAAGKGRFGLSANLHVRNRFFSVVDGKPFCLEHERDSGSAVYAALGKTMKLGELARHMIVTSNNLATNLLLDLIGVEQVRATLAGLGVKGVEVRRGVEDAKAYDAGVNNMVTANGLLSLFRVLQEGEGFAAEDAQRMLEILFQQEYNSGIPAGLPEAARAGARIAHKTGNISTVSHDAGLVFLKNRRPYAVSVLTSWEPGASGDPDTIAKVSRAVYEHLVEA
ncbi:MAG TPA: serine hydrolase [Pyrinomonadaceae bacterium]